MNTWFVSTESFMNVTIVKAVGRVRTTHMFFVLMTSHLSRGLTQIIYTKRFGFFLYT